MSTKVEIIQIIEEIDQVIKTLDSDLENYADKLDVLLRSRDVDPKDLIRLHDFIVGAKEEKREMLFERFNWLNRLNVIKYFEE